MKHTKLCTAAKNKYQKDLKEWKERWPSYCLFCSGFGYFIEYNYPYSEDGIYECESCIAKNICPRCGSKNKEIKETLFCDSCNWQGGINEDDFAPKTCECACDTLEENQFK